MLRGMDNAQRNRLVAQLPENDRKAAERIMGARFSAKERSEQDIDAWKRMSMGDQKSSFGTFNAQTQDQILRSFGNEDVRAKFISGLSPENQETANKVIKQRLMIYAIKNSLKAHKNLKPILTLIRMELMLPTHTIGRGKFIS